MIGLCLGLAGFCCPSFPFGFFFPLVSPWRLRYKGMAMGKAKTLDRAQGKATIRVSTTQSCPQLTRDLARLEMRGSNVMPAP